MVEPATTYAPSPIFTGAIKFTLLPTKAWSPISVSRLVISVIVHCNRAAADIHILPNLSVAYIAEMRYFAAITNLGILQFNEVADFTADAKLRAWAQVGIRAYSATRRR